MSTTDEQLEALSETIATGASRVRVGDKDTQFRSLDEMLAIERRLEERAGRKRRLVSTQGVVDRGRR